MKGIKGKPQTIENIMAKALYAMDLTESNIDPIYVEDGFLKSEARRNALQKSSQGVFNFQGYNP